MVLLFFLPQLLDLACLFMLFQLGDDQGQPTVFTFDSETAIELVVINELDQDHLVTGGTLHFGVFELR